MAYNPFRWFTEGKYRTKPLKKSSPLLLRIRNGDFEYSPFFLESKDNDKLYDDMFQQFMDTSLLKDINDKRVEAHELAKICLLYTSPSPRDVEESRMPSSA